MGRLLACCATLAASLAGAQQETITVTTTRIPQAGFDLPAAAVKYVRRIEELIGAPVALLSTSPDRDDTILMRDPFQG